MDERFLEMGEFISRLSEELKEKAMERYAKARSVNDRWIKNNPEKHKENLNQYQKTEHGKKKRKEIRKKRSEKFRESKQETSEHEMELIKDFYINCPDGYHVDHIIPVARGGLHKLENLQYLKATDNFRKGYKTNEEYELWKRFFLEKSI